ncbi:MAG: terminase [Porticoccus sp.]|jgi:phage terminase small subunit|uniref:terminase small subunit n=1 Tax=Pseudomonadota TaxID=1224 RepID=UPI000C3AC0B8|nr:terminase [Rhodospirillaceae bacterium]MAY26202.1 terminase [Polycyclovorans sp.]MBG58023.1 terminase [Porticoccus sp.]QDP49873.1 MAG: putative terminase small subunit [Prokaryotic dsDNA virus sp.]MAX61629.1 terminase [Rhodospirillaceae bacterium]|tara:strand:+ start:19909 stop:20355 length:447 start_codon:yes stop_codon:yes gene_type:complete
MALTPKQEKFAQAVASGMNQSDAYRHAYTVKSMKPSSVNVNASKLMADAKVSQRVADLRKPMAEAAQVTLRGHLEDLKMLRDLAIDEKQISAAIAAEVARGKAAGVHVESLNHHHSGAVAVATIDTSKLSNGTIAELLRARRAETDPG